MVGGEAVAKPAKQNSFNPTKDIIRKQTIKKSEKLIKSKDRKQSVSKNANIYKDVEIEKQKVCLTVEPGNKRIDEAVAEDILYRCPEICSDLLPKEMWQDRIREYVEIISESDEVLASIIAMKSLNPEKCTQRCLRILEKYLKNLILHPTNEAFKRIKFDNRALQEKVLNVEGSGRFLTAVGFQVLENETDGQQYFVYPYTVNEEVIADIVDLMNRATGFELFPDKKDSTVVKAEEVKRAESNQVVSKETRAINKRSTKKTKTNEKLKVPESKQTKIKVRFPDGSNFKATFTVDETLYHVKSFIDEKLIKPQKYTLYRPPAEPFTDSDYVKSLEQLQLFPAVLLHLKWLENVKPKIKQILPAKTIKKLK